jgi:CubicO group peptidase (beta-lactamase class C family)
MLQIYSLEQAIQERMGAQSVPGLALAIVQDQQVIYARGFGVTSVEDGGVSVTPQTLFRIGSTSKPLTGTAIMRLVEAGKLDLDCPINAYMDWLRFSEPGMEREITLRMLLSHTSGLHHSIPTNPALPVDYADQYSFETLEQYARELLPRCPFVAPPGKLYFYSNEGPTLAGYIAEVVSGMPFPQLMQELIFDPLQMKRTTYDIAVAMTYPVAQEHEWLDDGTVRVFHRFPESRAGTPAGPHPLSTVLDLANPAEWERFVGTYQGNSAPIRVSIEDGKLHLEMVEDRQKAACIPLDSTRFTGTLGLIEFLLGDDGMATGLLRHKLFYHPRVL